MYIKMIKWALYGAKKFLSFYIDTFTYKLSWLTEHGQVDWFHSLAGWLIDWWVGGTDIFKPRARQTKANFHQPFHVIIPYNCWRFHRRSYLSLTDRTLDLYLLYQIYFLTVEFRSYVLITHFRHWHAESFTQQMLVVQLTVPLNKIPIINSAIKVLFLSFHFYCSK